ncbi:MAG TPA: type VI secretion system accessory protein TagJ [Pyrinomonadaceae bacterium]|nr:type VI secretion system accessory protein TagJ [Pyrinomonadaceae bacterium]
MNNAKLELDAGNLKGAVEEAIKLVKSNPTNVSARTFLFELSYFSGEWDRAEKQLDAIGHQDANALVGTMIYRQNFKAERDRANFYSHGTRPESAMPFPEYVEDLIKATELVRLGEIAAARELLDKVDENRPEFRVTVNGEGFRDFRDYNDLTMCVFEAFIKDAYVWLPFEHVVSIEFLERKSLRDIFWPQAKFQLVNGISGELFMPALYVNTWKHENDLVRLGRSVDWRDLGNDLYMGEGAKLYWMSGRDRSLSDIKSIEFEHAQGAENA